VHVAVVVNTLLFKKKNKDDYRLSFPTTIQVELGLLAKRKPSENTWVSQNITATWVVCYLNGIFPDQTKHGWQNMECCSHRCAFNRQAAPGPSVMGWVCVEPTCLVFGSQRLLISLGATISALGSVFTPIVGKLYVNAKVYITPLVFNSVVSIASQLKF